MRRILTDVNVTGTFDVTGDTTVTGTFDVTGDTTVTGKLLVAAGHALHLFPAASITPTENGELVIEATDDTTLTFKLKGSDGTVRSAALTLA